MSASVIADRTRAAYTLPEGQNGVLRVYDALGRQIDQKDVRSTGEVEFSSPLSSGVYWIHLKAKVGQANSKVVLLD